MTLDELWRWLSAELDALVRAYRVFPALGLERYDWLHETMFFAMAWLVVSFLFLLATGRERTPLSPAGQRRHARAILLLSALLYGLGSGFWLLSALFAVGAGLLTRIVARLTPEWNSRGQAHLAAFGSAAALLVAPVLRALWYVAPTPLIWLPTLALLGLVLFIVFLSVGFAFDPLNVVCRARWRRYFPPITFPTGYYPKVSIHVPAHSEPTELVKETLRSLVRLDYPNYEIIMVDDNTAEPELWEPVMAFCREHGIRTYHLWAYPGFKSGALNFALSQSAPDAQIIAVVDADYQVEPSYLRETVGYFEDPRVAFVQTPQAFREVDTPFLKHVDLSQQYWFDIGMRSRNERNSIIFCGTMGLIRRSALERIGGWGEWCVTEDAEASLRMLNEGYQSVYVHKVYGRGLLPVTFDDLRKQRFRWALGGVQILRRYLPALIPFLPRRRGNRLDDRQRLDYLVGGLGWFADVAVLLFSLLLLFSAATFLLGRRVPTEELAVPALLLPLLLIYVGVLRTVWVMKVVAGTTWSNALGAFFTWLSLSLTVARACVDGLVHSKAAFLRTPKHGEPPPAPEALRSLGLELLLGGALAAAMFAVLAVDPGLPAVLFAGLLAWHASVYWSSPWNALSAYHGRSFVWRLVGAAGIFYVLGPYLVWLALSLPRVPPVA